MIAGHVACMRASKGLCKFDEGKSGERSLIIPRSKGKAILYRSGQAVRVPGG